MLDQFVSGLLSALSLYWLETLCQEIVHVGLQIGLGLTPVDLLLKRPFHLLLQVEPGPAIQILLLAKDLVRVGCSGGDERRPLPGLVSLAVFCLLGPLLGLEDRPVDPVSDAFGDRDQLGLRKLVHG